jgi:hypothetical protein
MPPLTPPSAAAPTAGPQLSSGEHALLDHVRQHDGRAEVICIVRPHNAAHDASEVFVLQGSTREFVEHLSKAHGGNAVQQGGRPSASARSDLAVLPAAEQLR